MKKVVIYGAGGYGGVGLVDLLLRHRGVEISALVSREGAGNPYSELYPHLRGHMDKVIEHADDFNPERRGELVFFSTPDGVGQRIARKYLDLGYKVIDFSGDFRFGDTLAYGEYASRQHGQTDHSDPELLGESVYGWPERYADKITSAKLVGNPGCMAMACLLALAPALQAKAIESNPVCDLKTGISGAGKKPKPGFHFPHAAENAYAYKVGKHQHVYEVERELGFIGDCDFKIRFTPHIIPAVRGILATCYLQLKEGVEFKCLQEAYRSYYKTMTFVNFDESGALTDLKSVRGTNTAKLSLHQDSEGQAVVLCAIDNLQKGQSGNAVQLMNLMLGFEQTEGLRQIPDYP